MHMTLPTANLRPELALIFHLDTNNRGVLVTRHDVDIAEGFPRIGAGSYVGIDDQRAILDMLTLNTQGIHNEMLPANVLACSGEKLAWHIPGVTRKMHFKVDGHTFTLTVPWPNLVIRIERNTMSVAALPHRKRPTPDTRLYHAPLMNIDEEGVLCTGNASLPQNRQIASIPQWESVLTGTFFTHVNHDMTFRAFTRKNEDGNDWAHIREWKRILKEGYTHFPTARMAPMGLTLGEWI